MRALQVDGPGVFCGRSGVVGVIPPAGGERPVEGERHDQDQAGETVGIA